MKARPEQEAENDLVLSYISVRQALGYLGVFLPISLIVIGVISGDGIEPSLSEFYFTSSGDLLVGTLCAIGVFMFTYQGFKTRPGEFLSDYWIAKLAAIGVIGIALIPTKGPMNQPLPLMHRLLGEDIARILHYASAITFFVCLAIFCLVLFCRHEEGKPISTTKAAQIRIYRICGWIIVSTMALMVLYAVFYLSQTSERQQVIDGYKIIFTLETVGVLAFAISWLTKGKTLTPLQKIMRKRPTVS